MSAREPARCVAPVDVTDRETYAARKAGEARASRVHADMQHSCSYESAKAADRAYESAYAAALVAVDTGEALCGLAATAERTVDGLVLPLCEEHAIELDAERAS